MNDQISFIPLGGVGDVTKNMYVYEYDNQMLVVDCGIGFADETMLGVDLLLPDISYVLKSISAGKKLVGMVFTHGHEDHIGALPFILPQLPKVSLFATPLTAALANEKLKEFEINTLVGSVPFGDNEKILGDFKVSFIRITHSVPDTSNIFIQTPVGNFYHGSDFKFDLTPADGKKTDFAKIVSLSQKGLLCLMSDALGAERPGHTPSETKLSENFEQEMRRCVGKFIVTTYSSNISRLNQVVEVAKKFGRKICFVGRSLIKTKEVAKRLGYMQISQGMEVQVDDLRKIPDKDIVLMVAGSQGQENSAMTRIAHGEHKDIKLSPLDMVVFSSDPIPGNEVSVNSLIDTIARQGARAVYSDNSNSFHVSGHGAAQDLLLMMSLTNPKNVLPIGATFRHMVAYKKLAKDFGFLDKNILLMEDGQEILFNRDGSSKFGRKVDVRNVYVDEITGEEIESFVLRDRQRLSEGGIVIVMAEVDSSSGQIIGNPDVIIRGFTADDDKKLMSAISFEVKKAFSAKKGRVTNWVYIRKLITEVSERRIFKELRRRPLVLPVVIEM